MKIQIKKWGNSAAVRTPASAMAAIAIDQAVEIREDAGRIIVEPIRAPANDLDDLLDRMTAASFHDDVDFGPAAGEEVW